MKPQHLFSPRPEDRRRDGSAEAEWGDSLPQWFRSEGFAEDLQSTAEPLPMSHRTGAVASRAAVALPLLGAGVAALLGLLVR